MRKLLLAVVLIGAGLLTGSSRAGRPNCANVYGSLSQGYSYAVNETCWAKDVTPWVYVNGHQLRYAARSDHANISTFYGWGAVVEVHTIHDRQVAVTATTVSGGYWRLRIRLAR